MLTIIIPALNAETTLAAAIASVKKHGPNVVVVDGGSTDKTRGIARGLGSKVIKSAPGRGRQLANGANEALNDGAEWLLFIHADSELCANWMDSVTKFINDPANKMRAAFFKLAMGESGNGAKINAGRVAGLANLRAINLGLPYGDQGLLISAEFYQKLGGFNQDMDLMEDVDMVRRIGKKNLSHLNAVITTSPARYVQDGWWARPIRNLVCLFLYYVGVNQTTLKRIYK